MIDGFQPAPAAIPLGGVKGRLDIAGDWQGTFGERKLRLVIRLTASDEDKDACEDNDAWKATLFSIDQSTQPIPIDTVTLEGHSFKFAANAIRSGYEGTIGPDGNSIAGTLIQGRSQPLDLQRATRESAWLSTPTRVLFIEVEEGVKLEVVDWGGTGRPVVLLAGLGADAHGYARFAARTDTFLSCLRHHSARLWSLQRSTDWLLGRSPRRGRTRCLGCLRPPPPGFGWTFHLGPGAKLCGFSHPDRVAGLVYLDAAWSFAYYDSSLGDCAIELMEVKRKMEELQSQFLEDTRPLIRELLETDLPRLERVLREWQKELDSTPAALLAAQTQAAPHIPPAVHAIHAGRQKYTDIPVPILALYALPPALGDRPIGTEAQATAFEAGVLSARVVRLPHARHEVFSSNEEDVLREMNAFIAKLP
jgi:pimeloyl-ACP methyl ester carboxylesterase